MHKKRILTSSAGVQTRVRITVGRSFIYPTMTVTIPAIDNNHQASFIKSFCFMIHSN